MNAKEFYEANKTIVCRVPRIGHPEDPSGWEGVRKASPAWSIAKDVEVMPLWDAKALKSGSAETGGEKAAPQKAKFISKFAPAIYYYDCRCDQCDAELDGHIPCAKCDIAVCSHKCLDVHECPASNFRRTSQNQTVSSGVGGAHEGTTADKKGALADSSLSSPPPEKERK